MLEESSMARPARGSINPFLQKSFQPWKFLFNNTKQVSLASDLWFLFIEIATLIQQNLSQRVFIRESN